MSPKKNYEHESLQVWYGSAPTSADPIDFDITSNHIAFRSVFATLVTEAKPNAIVGELAESWSASNNFKNWVFKIRPNLYFDNGEALTVEHILASFNRIILLSKKNKSKGSFTEKIEKLYVKNNELIFKLKQPEKKLLQQLSFGIYGVTHPSLFSEKTGNWAAKKIIASGPYSVDSWDKNSFVLRFRQDSGIPHAEKVFPIIKYVWNRDLKAKSDLILGLEVDGSLKKTHSFLGGQTIMYYLHCYSWKKRGGVLKSLSNRRALREALYKEYEKNGVKIIKSFFPLKISGMRLIDEDESFKKVNINASVLNTRPYPTTSFLKQYSLYNSTIKGAFAQNGVMVGVKSISDDKEFVLVNPNRSKYDIDIGILGTSILIGDPLQDIRFMFLSKEGIQLPDSNGTIKKELAKQKPDLQKINQFIWDQAIIWPLSHIMRGVWTSEKVSLKKFNLLQAPAFEFQWVESK